MIFAWSNHVGPPKRERRSTTGANVLNFAPWYRPEVLLPSNCADARLGQECISDVLQNAAACLLQPKAFTYPPRNLFGMNGTFGLDDRKSETADLGGTEIE